METLKEKLQRIQERVEGGMSSQFLKIMHSATRDLEASGIGQQVLRRGATAPGFELKNQQGEKLSSDHLLTTCCSLPFGISIPAFNYAFPRYPAL